MKDLANLYYFEKLLEDVNNDLVRQAQAKGNIAIGAVCFQIPEPLINLPGSFSVRLRAPRTGSIEMGTYYMSSMLCEGCRAILERAIEGKKVTVYETVQKEIKKDLPSRLHARRQMLKVLYPVTEVPTEAAGKKANTKKVDLTAKLFDE